jgi:hypothetical protein
MMEASEHLDAARHKMAWRDGAGCLAELDAHDRLDARPSAVSTSERAVQASMLRAQCLMLAGQCDAGRKLMAESYTYSLGLQTSPLNTQRTVDAMVGLYCQGASLSPRDQFLVARFTLQQGASATTATPATCLDAYRTIRRLRTTVTPKDDDDLLVKDPLSFLVTAAPGCVARAGDCAGAYSVYREATKAFYESDPRFGPPMQPWWNDDARTRSAFESTFPRCKNK